MKGIVSDLVHVHAGRAAVVVGGGMSAPDQLTQCPADAVYISANQHGCLLRKCDYIAAMDNIFEKIFEPPDGEPYTLRKFNTPIIAPRPAGDYWLFEQPLPSTGIVACWLAWIMGCAPIIPIGMDLYQGGTYFHDPKATSSGRALSVSFHVARWMDLRARAQGGQFRPFGGALDMVFPAYDPDEPAAAPCPRERALELTAGAAVQFSKACSDLVAPRLYRAGDRAVLSRKIAKKCVASKVADYLCEAMA